MREVISQLKKAHVGHIGNQDLPTCEQLQKIQIQLGNDRSTAGLFKEEAAANIALQKSLLRRRTLGRNPELLG